jgi:hypothetical protein
LGDLIRRTIGRFATPPPMPVEAFPHGGRMVPGVRAAMEAAWQAMGYQMFLDGVMVGAVATLVLIVAVLIRANVAKVVSDHLKGAAPHA